MRGTVILLASLSVAAALLAQGEAKRQADPARLVVDLGSPEYGARARAEAELWRLGEASRPALTAALKSDDAEVARRAKLVLDKFAAGDYPDTPPEVLKLRRDFRSGEPAKQRAAFRALVKSGPEALPVLRSLLAPPLRGDNAAAQRVVFSRELATAAPQFVLAGQGDFLEDALALNALMPTAAGLNDYATYARLRGRLPAAVARLEAADAATPAAADSARRALVYAYRAAGRTADALKLAKLLEDGDPAYRVVVDALLEAGGDWAGLAARTDANANSYGGLAAFRLRQAGQFAAADALLDAERDSTDRLTAGYSVDPPTLALFSNGRPAEAITRLTAKRNAPQILADVLAAQLRFGAALDLLNERSRKLDEEAEIDVASLKPLYGARRAVILARLGERDAAAQLFEQAHAQVLALPNASGVAITQLVRAEVRVYRHELACEHFGKWLAWPGRQEVASRYGQDPFELIFEADAEAATFLWGVLKPAKDTEGQGPAAEAMRTVRRLLLGQATPDAVADALKAARREATVPRSVGATSQALAVASILRADGRPDEAVAELARHADRLASVPPDPDVLTESRGPVGARGWIFGTDESYRFWVELGDLLVEQGRPKEAAERLLQGAAYYPGNAILIDLAGRARAKAGDAAGGAKLLEAAHVVPLGNARLRARYLEELLDRGHTADALRERELAADCAVLGEGFLGNVWNRVARAATAGRDFPTAAAASRKSIHSMLRTPGSSFVEGTAYLVVPELVRAYEAQAKLAAGTPRDLDAGVALLREGLAVLPGGTDQLAPSVAALDKAGRKAEATELFRVAFDAYGQVIRDYPESAWARHSAAWLASGCRREPEAALKYARAAVAAEPTVRAYREGLAEAHFRAGDRAAALTLMAKLVAEDRRSDHYKRQLQRYRSGDLKSPLPESDDDS